MTRREPLSDETTLTAPTDEARNSYGAAFERLVGLMARLRGPNGCPWDRAQSLETLRPYLIEEAYEVLDAIEAGDVEEHKEELGDLLLQVVFQSEVRRGDGAFDVADVAHGIADKLVRRHPHVFDDKEAHSPDHAYQRWEEMKAEEKGDRSVLAGVPRHLPALLRAQRVQDKASKVGFDWSRIEGPLEKLREELAELDEALAGEKKEEIAHEIGDLLFTVVNVCRFIEVDAEAALRQTIDRFSKRFEHVETAMKNDGVDMKSSTIDELELRWQAAKKQLDAQKIS